ncbi:MarR family transcriptional regulator [Paenibacillus cisolokensis]|uniref:MarR family winged helix-turn-helix transcriptional regulator n=1 Tax=Paenibacillus cisolokensis TaxID=1658519 RepID=UPI003D28FFFA
MSGQDQSLKLFVVLSKAYKFVMDRAVKDMKRNGLSATEFSVMELLYHKGRTPLQRIGDKILITSGSITYTVDKLEQKGYIRRVSSPDDRRVTYAEMTPLGTELFDRIFPEHAKVIDVIMGELTAEEKQAAIALLKKIGYKAAETR